MKKSVILFSTIVSFLAFSCGSDTAIHLQEENNAAVLKAEVEKAFSPDMEVSELLLSTPPLDTRLQNISVEFWEGEEEFQQFYNLKEGMQPKEETLASQNIKRLPQIPAKSKDLVFTIKDVDYSKTYENFIKAVTMVMEEYPEDSDETYNNFVLHSYRFKAEGKNKIRASLTLHAKKVGEAVRYKKRSTSTNYYEFSFVVLEDGTLEWR
ncbi:hypothetical protein [Myroides sp. WP-1]|uniref:hypothetical protein n=1 Tax=Myroides sp. WP-1 TaxID=2759944 RepID=UPI0015FAC266|nr:hypothetical protein [Myroides sp. WP-1]MBB1140523.1 hypothetical protein [Myroides sp. WP-1]